MLRVKNFSSIYQNNRTRELKTVKWIPLPIKLDGDGYCTIMAEDDGPAIFGAWIACLEIVAKTEGVFVRSSGEEHTAESLSRITRMKPSIISRMIAKCGEIGWLDAGCDNVAGKSQEGATIPQEGATLLCSVMSCNVLSSVSEDESAERRNIPDWNSRHMEFLTAGPPCWMNYEMQSYSQWKSLGASRPDCDADSVIASAKAFKAYTASKSTKTQYITKPQNFIAQGAYGTDWEKEMSGSEKPKTEHAEQVSKYIKEPDWAKE